jgi:hypothetical protein
MQQTQDEQDIYRNPTSRAESDPLYIPATRELHARFAHAARLRGLTQGQAGREAIRLWLERSEGEK